MGPGGTPASSVRTGKEKSSGPNGSVDDLSLSPLSYLFLLFSFPLFCPSPSPSIPVCNADYPCEGMSRHATFENFGMAFLTLFQVSTGDNWNGIMKVGSTQDP